VGRERERERERERGNGKGKERREGGGRKRAKKSTYVSIFRELLIIKQITLLITKRILRGKRFIAESIGFQSKCLARPEIRLL
jgi:hypothetical protein